MQSLKDGYDRVFKTILRLINSDPWRLIIFIQFGQKIEKVNRKNELTEKRKFI